MNTILEKIKKEYKNKNMIFLNKNDVYFITRIKSSNLILLLINGHWYALTDSRYYEKIKKELDIKTLNMTNKNWFEDLKKKEKFSILNVNSNDITVQKFKHISKMLKKHEIKLFAKNFPYLRNLYLPEDTFTLKQSSKINDEIFNEVSKKIKVGMTEIEVKNMILKAVIDSDADGVSFDPIVASGKSGGIPHWEATNKKIKKNEMLTIDMGVFYKGFASDMTRTFIVKGKITKEEHQIWSIVKEALDESIAMIKEGVPIKELHLRAQSIIEANGYGQYFNHALGHGIGVEIHDEPIISPSNEAKLEKGMVITIEPGIYIPNKYGVRLEQAVLVTKDGYEVLNNTKIDFYL